MGGGSNSNSQAALKTELQLLWAVGGIYTFYILYGVFQERVTQTPRGAEGEKFKFTLFLVFLQCIFNALFALIVLAFKRFPQTDVTLLRFFPSAATYIGAMFASNTSLLYINYPTQVLAKSCKMVPVMLMGVLLNGKRYSLQEYLCVGMITCGIAAFTFFKKAVVVERENDSFGMFLVILSLVLDGFTAPSQERAVSDCRPGHRPLESHLQFYCNFWAVVITGVFLLFTGEGAVATNFIMRHPGVAVDIAGFSLCSALGQNFIFFTIANFNALICATITTTRKFFTIIFSVFFFGHAVNMAQWGGASMVFIGLMWDSYSKYQRKHRGTNQTFIEVGGKEGVATRSQTKAKARKAD